MTDWMEKVRIKPRHQVYLEDNGLPISCVNIGTVPIQVFTPRWVVELWDKINFEYDPELLRPFLQAKTNEELDALITMTALTGTRLINADRLELIFDDGLDGVG